jgi:GMP synthase (glutamine-hydrolysing)
MTTILIMKTGGTIPAIATEFGDFEDWIINATTLPARAFTTVTIHTGDKLPSLDKVSSVIITGSPAMVTQDLGWIRAGEAYLRNAIQQGIPVLGICFGHQLLAQALGGRVDYHPGGREIGTTRVALSTAASGDPLFSGLPEHFPAHVTHMQSILALPPGAQVLAGNEFEPHQGVRFAEKAWGVQFHPEFDAPVMAAYIRERFNQVRSEGLDPEQLLGEVEEADAARTVLARFVAMYS